MPGLWGGCEFDLPQGPYGGLSWCLYKFHIQEQGEYIVLDNQG